ncbi:hypothetical protein [Streptomyces meridianus]|uniref:DUF1049 domain-containing protein n=1 Tax=Streptomyces meridianus TaxID=2938945 RepID=A0ABT0X663_9ACTN|nr:hypothetical protein [Streptomyces meridianus]MCM2578023.1 hypothetical protein [Streptomyces meridianus]
MARTGKHQQSRTPFLSRPGVRRLAGFVLVTAIALVFVFENTTSVKIRLLVPEVTMPLWGALLIAWGLGILGAAFTLHRRR